MGRRGNTETMVEGVDLFCGAGGLTLGLQRAGINVTRGYDLDPACEFPYVTNTGVPFVKADISQLTPVDVASAYTPGATRLLAGCAPCQTFSTYTRGRKSAKSDDNRWQLLHHFERIVEDLLPELVTMENVPRIKDYAVFKGFALRLETLGYCVKHKVVDCADLGAPQARRRIVLLASRISIPAELQPVRLRQTVRDAIFHLPPIAPGQAHDSDPLHYSSALTPLSVRRVEATPEGGDWRDWPDELKLECHKKESGKTYRGVFGRMIWDGYAPTLTTLCGGIGNGRFVHPNQHRGISLREAALLQTFPADYTFAPKGQQIKPRVVARLIGNAVPPLLGEAIGNALLSDLPAAN